MTDRLDDDADRSGDYCREVETHLCRRNQGHLIRIVGPAFERVQDWAARGVPLKVALRGIDRCVDRHMAGGRRRRPVRVEFCEADVLDVFDEWRRAVGIGSRDDGAEPGARAADQRPRRRHASLPAHIERVIARLIAIESGDGSAVECAVHTAAQDIERELAVARGVANGLRGEARVALIAHLAALDARLIEAAKADCDAATRTAMGAEADLELAPFRDRMAPPAYERAREACVTRLIRERARLPIIAFQS